MSTPIERLLDRDLERYLAIDPERLFFEAAARAAQRFRIDSLAPGRAGVGALARALLGALSEEDGADESPDDDELIEGFGALLGLSLADALGGSVIINEGRSGIRFGRFGYFDPFSAVRAAIDADDMAAAREALALYLDEAAAEARGEGPVARAFSVFAQALIDEDIPPAFEPLFPAEVKLPRGEIVSLERLIGGEGDQALIARQLARMLKRGDAALSEEERATIVYPRLVGDHFLEELGVHRTRLYAEPIAEGLWLAFIAHYGDRARFLRADEVPDPKLQRAQSVELLERSSPALKIASEGELLSLSSRDGLDAARVLLSALKEELVHRLGERIYLGIPHRDLLLAGADPEALRAHVESAYARAPHRISKRIYLLGRDGLVGAI